MNPTLIHDGMRTFVASQLARWEGREEDAEFLEEGFSGTQGELATGIGMVASWLLLVLAIERDEDVEDTLRVVLDRLAVATVAHEGHEECGGSGESGDEPGGP